MTMRLSLQPANVLTSCGDEQGYLVSVDDRLAAVLVRLDDEFHGEDRGRWNLEAGFGACEVRSCDPFAQLSDALVWVADRVGAPASSAHEAVRAIAGIEGLRRRVISGGQGLRTLSDGSTHAFQSMLINGPFDRMGVIAIKIFLDRLQLLSPLRNGEGAELAGTCSNVVELQEGIDLASEGDEPECLHVILEGWACRYVLLPDGRRHISALLLPGDVADLDALEAEHLEFGVCTLTRCRVAALSRTALRTAIERAPGLARAFLALAIAENAALARRNVSLGRRTAREQVASVLCELVTRLAEGNVSARVGKHTLPLTQSEFADLLGLSPVHVNRVLQSLRADNLIRLAGKRLEVLDWAGLVDAAALQPDGAQPARSSHERCAESGPGAHQTVLRHA